MERIRNFIRFIVDSAKHVASGNRYYYAWVGFLLAIMAGGAVAYASQINHGLIVTSMRDQVSWGFYIGNFTFLVGVAAAAIMLVIPAYVYEWEPIKEVTILGEILAIAALLMCFGFVTVDIGRPDRVWHITPLVGTFNFPSSLLAWDVVALNGYLLLNWIVVTYMLYCAYTGRHYRKGIVYPLVLLSIPMAVSIHTVTAYLFNGLAARPFWNVSILAPKFLASAFCSGPAIMMIIFQVIRKVSKIEIDNKAIFKIAELVAYAMGINLFLLAAEFFKEFYSGSVHLAPMEYLYFGLHGHTTLVPWMWTAMIFNITAFILFISPATRENFLTLNLACVLICIGVYIEKGMGLSVPGFVPSTLGEIYEYSPTLIEKLVSLGIWSTGALVFTLLVKFAMPVYTGEVRFYSKHGAVR